MDKSIVSRETQPKYELLSIDENGNEVRRYQDGTLRNQKGHALTRIANGNAPITTENAREYHQKRKDKILQAIEKSLKDVTKTRLPADAIAAIVAKRAKIAMTDDTKVGNDAARIVLQAVDAYQSRQADEQTNVIRHEYAIDDDTKRILDEMIAAKRRTNVLTIEATETTEEE